jgi:hypothetical protein
MKKKKFNFEISSTHFAASSSETFPAFLSDRKLFDDKVAVNVDPAVGTRPFAES